MAATGTTAQTPALLAKGALRRLAQARLEPTPENFARAYAEESGQAAEVLPERARASVERLTAAVIDDPAARQEAVQSLVQGEWDRATRHIDAGLAAHQARQRAWPDLLARTVRGLERGGRQWTTARRKDSLQRVLDGSRADPLRMLQRLQSLVASWDSDAAGGDGADETQGKDTAAETAVAAAEVPSAPSAPIASATAAQGAGHIASPGADWAGACRPLAQTVQLALPAAEPRAKALADELGRLADRLARDGAQPGTVREIEDTCLRAQRLLGHRAHLFDAVGSLCQELSDGLVELAEDQSWARGQCDSLRSRLAQGLNARGVRAATTLLAETRQRQSRVRADRDAANQALKALIQRLLGELGELGQHTDRFEADVGRHVQAIERADSLEGLSDVVRELLDDTRRAQTLVRQTRDRLAADQSRASELEARVRDLESELRRLSDEVATDALTQVANRRGLQQAFEAEAARVQRAAPGEAGGELAVGLIDIDNFKKLNDSLGHAAGDEALKSLAAAVRDRLRPVDTVARFGGEEFVLLLPGTPADEAQQVVTRLQRGLSASLFMHEGREVFVTFSAGVTAWRSGEPLDAALERADEALYEAKRTGKNRTCVS